MKRDFDLVRLILLDMEKAKPMELRDRFEFEGYEQNDINEHIELMIEAGFLEGNVVASRARRVPQITRMTWQGHDFLDASRDSQIWEKAKATILKPIGGVAFGVLLDWLKREMAQRLGLPQGE